MDPIITRFFSVVWPKSNGCSSVGYFCVIRLLPYCSNDAKISDAAATIGLGPHHAEKSCDDGIHAYQFRGNKKLGPRGRILRRPRPWWCWVDGYRRYCPKSRGRCFPWCGGSVFGSRRGKPCDGHVAGT